MGEQAAEQAIFLERFKKAFSSLGVIAANYLPKGFKDSMIDMAHEVDKLRAEINELKRTR